MELLGYEKKHLQLLRGRIAECTTFLNHNHDFPLEEPGKIALYGSGSRYTIKGGTGSGEVNSRYFVTVEQGLQNAGFQVTTKSWLDGYDQVLAQAKVDFIKEIKAKAKAAHTNAVVYGMGAVMPEPEYDLPLEGEGNTAIYVLSRISGEGNDRSPVPGDIFLSKTEQRDILALNQKYQRFMLVLNVGGPVDLTPVKEVENILLLSQLGVDTGSILADILLGKQYPSGKLTTTWTSWEDYPTIGDFGDNDDTRYQEGIYVGYRYFDTVGKRPLYPFGYGMGYTDFEISTQKCSVDGTTITVQAEVKNIGAFAGKDVLQLYVSVPEGKLDQPYQALAGFVKTKELRPGESTECSISFDFTELASYDEASTQYILEPGDYILRLGTDSVNTTICGVIRQDEMIVTMKVRNALGRPDFTDWTHGAMPETILPEDVTICSVSANAVSARTIDYDVEPLIDVQVEQMSDEELTFMNIGAFEKNSGIGSIIGDAAKSVAGAAGETTDKLKDKNIPTIVMADGPAGLRLAPDYTKDEDGEHSLGNPMIDSMAVYLNGPTKLLLNLLNRKKKHTGETLHHYTTAIPIGTAIAQSWNMDFAQECGDIVGDEMERMEIDLWLAPALNIHRSIRCGRNFEYYSEDPLISGKCAAAVTRGVQSHLGCGVTIKHYAANNQETNRYSSNSQVSERAMREIYLRGFGICVRESQPKSVMTSYNLLNGIHTSERRDLMEDVLRCEFGFDGIVMTDWVIAGLSQNKNARYPFPEAYKVAMAGNDLFMPGSQKEFDNIISAIMEGRIDRKQLMVNATRVKYMAQALKQKRK